MKEPPAQLPLSETYRSHILRGIRESQGFGFVSTAETDKEAALADARLERKTREADADLVWVSQKAAANKKLANDQADEAELLAQASRDLEVNGDEVAFEAARNQAKADKHSAEKSAWHDYVEEKSMPGMIWGHPLGERRQRADRLS